MERNVWVRLGTWDELIITSNPGKMDIKIQLDRAEMLELYQDLKNRLESLDEIPQDPFANDGQK